MSNNSKIFWLICLTIALSSIIYTKTSSFRDAVVILGGTVGLVMAVGKYRYVFMDASQHVAKQAAVYNKTPAAMWLEMLKKVLLYLFLPAAILTVVLVIIGLKTQQ